MVQRSRSTKPAIEILFKEAKEFAMIPRYHIDVFWWPQDECWIANVPDLSGCSAHGETPGEAIKEVGIATELWLETTADHGDPIPVPHYRSEVSTFDRAA